MLHSKFIVELRFFLFNSAMKSMLFPLYQIVPLSSFNNEKNIIISTVNLRHNCHGKKENFKRRIVSSFLFFFFLGR